MNTNKKRNIKAAIIIMTFSFIAAHLCTWLLPDVFETWNAKVTDQLFKYRSNSDRFRPPYDDTIVHVDLNNTSIQQLKQFYLNRTHHAKVIKNLSEMNVASQLYDFIFAAQSNESEDQALIEATANAGNVYFGVAFDLAQRAEKQKEGKLLDSAKHYLDQTKWDVTVKSNPSFFYKGINPLLTFLALSSVSHGLGFLNINPDRDGVFRRIPLLIRYQDGFYPSLPFRVVCDFLKVPPDKIIIDPGKSITLKDTQRPGNNKAHDIVIPIDQNGNFRINFIGPWERMKHYNLSDVLKASDDIDDLELWAEELSGKIIIVSEVTTGSSDIGPVPTDTNFPLSGLHANVIHSILTESFLKDFSYGWMILIELFLMIIIIAFSYRFSSLFFSIASVGLIIFYLFISSYLFLSFQIILHIVRPFFMSLLFVGLIVIYRYVNEEKERLLLRKSFESYFPPTVVKKIIHNPELISTKGHKKELTILFSDIKSFTKHSSTMKPEQVQKLLNEYFEAMTEIAFEYGGTVDKFIGDGLMVFFGDPEPQKDHALRCVKSAIEMQDKVKELRKIWLNRGDMPLHIRIGINTGEVFVGNMGSKRRLSYSVLGANVNLAQRLESNAPVDGILISEKTNDLIKDYVETDGPKHINPKGYDELITVFEVSL